MSGTDIAKAYDPSRVESRWYAEWLKAGAFAGVADPARAPYCIVIPPPNVTGVLTMGHVLNNTLQDILVRRARQEGKGVLWLPGTDHAGLATQTRVEKELRQQGLDRRKMGREKFFQRVVEWRDQHGGIIIEQLKRLGCSCDWSRTVHTLDPAYSRAVLTAFVKLYQRDFIYRGLRMVNWCPASLTALSDEEVISTPQKGTLYHLKYEIVERPGEFLHIATTRPETLMGDTAVAVHPNDPRYQHLQGAHVWRPFPRAAIPIIFDSIVDEDFGSGALKVTPAHDKVDFAIGQRHHLPILDVLNPDGTLNALAGEEFSGVDRFKARKLAAEKLRSLGLLVKEEPYENNVGFSERANVPIEPRLSEQWFLRYPRIEEAKAAVRDGHIKFWPDHWSKVYLNWLDKIQDWCISRQVWWGHRIPVWYRKGLDRAHLTEADYKNPAKVQVSVDGPADPENWEQEEDSLDTWASSWLWPFATLGWPEPDAKQAKELTFWYPTSDLVTGPDIIFFWVARMIVAGLEFMTPEAEQSKTRTEREKENQPLSVPTIQQCIPFKNVYFTGIIRDKQGRKMSKSLGNSPDPVALIEKYGADGLRFGTISSAPQGNDILFDEANVELGRNFCNKLWNAARFRQMQGDVSDYKSLETIFDRVESARFDDTDHGVIYSLINATENITFHFACYEFDFVARLYYDLFWSVFCDWYVEVAKAKLTEPNAVSHVTAMLDVCLRQILLLLHPLMPFITEDLWHSLGFASSGSFIGNTRPSSGNDLLQAFEKRGIKGVKAISRNNQLLRGFVAVARELKAKHNLGPKRDVVFNLDANNEERAIVLKFNNLLLQLIGSSRIVLLDSGQHLPEGTAAALTPLGTLYLNLAGSIDKSAERSRLSKELEKLDQHIAGQEAKLANEAFTSKAPAKVVEGARAQLVENLAKREELRRLLENLK
jgi:valyl-tRNA synthetase